MVAVNVTDRFGKKHTLEVRAGGTLMEALRGYELGIDAICGGCCSCATCHVFVDAAWIPKLPPPSDDEQELIGSSAHYQAEHSRLSCQLRLTDALNGISIIVAPRG